MRTNYILIDYENVQPAALPVLNQEHFRVIVFVGATQTKIAFDTAAALQDLGSRAKYIKITSTGTNALDFHIAYYIGSIAAREPDAYFHIISKDSGFDPLIQHLKTQKVQVCRSREITDIPIVKAATAISSQEKIEVIISNLQQRGTSKPRTLKTLSSTINALFLKQLPDEEVAILIQELQKQGVIRIQDTKVIYAPSE